MSTPMRQLLEHINTELAPIPSALGGRMQWRARPVWYLEEMRGNLVLHVGLHPLVSPDVEGCIYKVNAVVTLNEPDVLAGDEDPWHAHDDPGFFEDLTSAIAAAEEYARDWIERAEVGPVGPVCPCDETPVHSGGDQWIRNSLYIRIT